MTSKIVSSEPNSSPETQALSYQLDILKEEIRSIGEIIARFDGMCQSTKYWTIISWTGGIAICLEFENLRNILLITAFLPALFWYLDAFFRYLQARSIYRGEEIREWLNSDDYVISFRENKLVNFRIFDPAGRVYKRENANALDINIAKTWKYKEVMFFYMPMIIVSIVLQAVLWFVF